MAAQTAPLRLDWRHIGNSGIDLSLAAPATGPVDRVWFSADGTTIYARTHSGRTLETQDLEGWKLSQAVPPDSACAAAPGNARLPESAFTICGLRTRNAYSFGRFIYRSSDAGISWSNLTAWQNHSLIGDGTSDLAVSPVNDEEVIVANRFGVWRSVDAGSSWSGLNGSLPAFPATRLLQTAAGSKGIVVEIDNRMAEWAPGEKQAWRVRPESVDLVEREMLSRNLRTEIRSIAHTSSWVYAGAADGTLWASNDGGSNWLPPFRLADSGPVEAIFADAKDPRFAVAVLGAGSPSQPESRPVHVLRTFNGGGFWDDFTGNLPDTAVHGVAVDRASNSIYVATNAGLYLGEGDLMSAGAGFSWNAVAVPAGATRLNDVRLDPNGNQLYMLADGLGVYAAIAPHRFRDPRLVSAADYASRPAAPGALLTVLGARLQRAQAGGLTAPVLAASETESQIQVPFESRGGTLSFSLELTGARYTVGVPLQSVAPAIFVDREGAPMLLDAESGVVLDAMAGAHSNSRIQILATGLGRVKPDWPTGLAAPIEEPPQVVAPVKAYLDRTPVNVTRAVLAPGYIGFYLVEVQLPKIVNYGPAELYIEADGQPSNRVRVYIEP